MEKKMENVLFNVAKSTVVGENPETTKPRVYAQRWCGFVDLNPQISFFLISSGYKHAKISQMYSQYSYTASRFEAKKVRAATFSILST